MIYPLLHHDHLSSETEKERGRGREKPIFKNTKKGRNKFKNPERLIRLKWETYKTLPPDWLWLINTSLERERERGSNLWLSDLWVDGFPVEIVMFLFLFNEYFWFKVIFFFPSWCETNANWGKINQLMFSSDWFFGIGQHWP